MPWYDGMTKEEIDYALRAITDQLMAYHRGVCEALGISPDECSPQEAVEEIRRLVARPTAGFAPPLKTMLAERERCARIVGQYITTRAGRDLWVNDILIEIQKAIRAHDTLQDGEAGAETDEPRVKGSSMSISDKPSGIEG